MDRCLLSVKTAPTAGLVDYSPDLPFSMLRRALQQELFTRQVLSAADMPQQQLRMITC